MVSFLNLSGSTSLVADVVFGVCEPKAIPHFQCTPMVHIHTSMHYLRLISTKVYMDYLSELASQSR